MTHVPSCSGNKPALKLLSLFSGAGGMDIGLELAGFEPVACLEIDELAKKTLVANRSAWPVWDDGDVITMAATTHPTDLGLEPGELDLLGDLRANTVHALLDIFEKFKPKAVFLENVQGFLTGKSSALPEIQARVHAVNAASTFQYRIHWKFVNAADYGVPQNRKRSMMIIARDDISWRWPDATHRDQPITAWDAIGDLVESSSELPELQGKWSDLLPSIPEGWNYQWLTNRGGGEEIFGYRTKYWNFLLKLAKNKPAWTLPASPGPATGPFHWDNRPLSARERLRLQSFPDHWKLEGDIRAQTKLAGNATPPLLAEVIGRQLADAFGQSNAQQRSVLLRPNLPLTTHQSQPRPVPPSYQHLIGTKHAHKGTGRGPAPRSNMEPVSSLEV